MLQLEQLQRAFMKRIQFLPTNTATSAAYGLLGIRPIHQELDLRKLTLLGSVLHNKNTLEYEIAQLQLAVKSLGSKSWFLYKYNLPNIYHVEGHLESTESWKSLLKKHIDLYIESELHQDHKISLQYLNVQSLKVGQIHQVWKSIPHDSRAFKRAYLKLRLLTGTYIMQENRSTFNQYAINDRCLLCEAGAETRTHSIAACSRLASVINCYL